MKTLFAVLSFFVLILAGCSSSAPSSYTVALNPLWPSLNLSHKEAQISAFSYELMEKIGEVGHINFSFIRQFDDQLIEGLINKKYDAVLTDLEPHVFYQYLHFSEPYLDLTDVIVINHHNNLSDSINWSTSLIGVLNEETELLILKNNPQTRIKRYESYGKALSEVAEGSLDAIIMNRILASHFIKELYPKQLTIQTSSIFPYKGLRLLTLKDHPLPSIFNQILLDLKEKKGYHPVLTKWDLD
ncbi:MAG: transporter substrate-binding domain-containing protein [Rhabdochlamydiaceae bacterium]